ncbi:diguanylate cyclase domain-containing protein [Dryocola sp. BD626]|uniref:GGDEF domain-containing protein n=1 Tax=Dryocola sp. BD626 TaxID=3133273 RepID=UPI003F50A629
MKFPGFPPDEERRLRALRASGILGAGQGERFDRLTRLAKRIFDVPIAWISLVDEDRLWLKSCAGTTFDEALARNTSFSAHALLEPEPTIIQDALNDPRFFDNPLVTGHPHICFYAGYPLKLPDGTAAGLFCLIDHRPREFSAYDMQGLKDLAAIAEDEFAVLDAANADELTGLFNRRGFRALAQYSLVASLRRAEPLSLACIDLDDFKQINDTWGQPAGDEALVAFAELLKASFRETDLLSRRGSDEFVVIFPDTPEQGAYIALEYLKEQVEEYNRGSDKPWKLGFTVGIAEFNERVHETPEALIEYADSEMCKMKKARKKTAHR